MIIKKYISPKRGCQELGRKMEPEIWPRYSTGKKRLGLHTPASRDPCSPTTWEKNLATALRGLLSNNPPKRNLIFRIMEKYAHKILELNKKKIGGDENSLEQDVYCSNLSSEVDHDDLFRI